MKLVALSDTHSMHSAVNVPPGDVLVHCGDFCNHGTLAEFKDFMAWFGAQPHDHKVVIPGNHDLICEKNLPGCRAFVPPGVDLLVNEEVMIDGKKFYGSPVTPQFGNWAFMKPRGKYIAKVWRQIPNDVRVLITHGPPFGAGDLAPPYWTVSPKHAGCLELLKRLQQIYKGANNRPFIHLFGHIHDGYGVTSSDEFGGSTFGNAAICDEHYRPVNAPLVMTIK